MHWRQNSTYRDDAKFIKQMTERVNERQKIINHYSVYWTKKHNEETEPHKKENYATRQANIRFRQMIKDYMNGEQIEDVNPPIICGNCHYLGIDSICSFYKQSVPNDFIDKENNCEQYKNGVPF